MKMFFVFVFLNITLVLDKLRDLHSRIVIN